MTATNEPGPGAIPPPGTDASTRERDGGYASTPEAAVGAKAANRIEQPYWETNADLEVLMPHLVWQLDQVLSEVVFDDLEPSEVVALLSILGPVHARVLASAQTLSAGRLLRLVRDDDSTRGRAR